MLQILLVCLAAVAVARPQDFVEEPVAILRDERIDYDGYWTHHVEAENGIARETSYITGSEGQTNMQGVFRMPFPDGSYAEVRFVSNEFGYQPESDYLPTPHPLPAHAIEQLRIAEEQRAAGITFE